MWNQVIILLSRPEAPGKEINDMGLYRRGKIFWFTIKHAGKRIQESIGTENKKLAEKVYAKALNEIVEGKWFEKQKAHSP